MERSLLFWKVWVLCWGVFLLALLFAAIAAQSRPPPNLKVPERSEEPEVLLSS